ncbi:MAG: sensor histidine kinase [Anaerolineales bacterium]|nr:sensor histidine kinase [Anaerolineales bacterium]
MATSSTSSTPPSAQGERAFFVFLTLVFVGAYALAVVTKPDLRTPLRLIPLTAVLGLHLALHWAVFFGKLRPSLNWIYVLTQGLLAFAVAVLAGDIGLYFGVFMALVGEVVGIFRGKLLQAIAAAAYLIALALVAYGLSFGWSELTWWAVSSLPMTLFVVIYVTLYSRQAEARERAQLLAGELEAANRQLSDYAARVEDLTIAAERQRIARELHDTLSQGLAGLILQLEAVDAHLGSQRVEKAKAIVGDAMTQARVTLADARSAIDDLRGAPPDDPESAICREVARFSEATGIAAECRIDPDLGSIEGVSETALRIVTEALTNAARHAQAHQVTVTAARQAGALQMTITDDGCGFDPTTVPTGHYGLLGMRERARLVGGEVALSSRPGAGTTVTARLPLEAC